MILTYGDETVAYALSCYPAYDYVIFSDQILGRVLNWIAYEGVCMDETFRDARYLLRLDWRVLYIDHVTRLEYRDVGLEYSCEVLGRNLMFFLRALSNERYRLDLRRVEDV